MNWYKLVKRAGTVSGWLLSVGAIFVTIFAWSFGIFQIPKRVATTEINMKEAQLDIRSLDKQLTSVQADFKLETAMAKRDISYIRESVDELKQVNKIILQKVDK